MILRYEGATLCGRLFLQDAQPMILTMHREEVDKKIQNDNDFNDLIST